MIRHIFILVILCAFINFTIGCSNTATRSISVEQIPGAPDKITSIILTDGTVIRYTPEGAMFHEKYKDRTNVVAGLALGDIFTVTPLDSILEARVERTEANVGGTILTVIGVAALAFGILIVIAIATKQSCPFVYSYDGQKYTFDAEPDGGAITKGLKRTDYSRMEHLRPVDGTYRLMVRNEANESQYIDEMTILAIDHPASLSISPDYSGTFYGYRTTVPPISAKDENGNNLMNFFRDNDNIRWQSKMPADTTFRGKDLRHHLTLSFPNPGHPASLKLLVNAGVSQWGSNMIREMLSLRGSDVGAWYKDIDGHGEQLTQLREFLGREELFDLKINVREGSSWVPRGVIRAGGPLIDEDRIVDVDVSHATGDTLFLQLNPPKGYWKIDYIGEVSDPVPVSRYAEIPVSRGTDSRGTDITSLLRSNDDVNYSMPEVGDRADLIFTAPPETNGLVRTLYLRTSGYYNLHLPQDAPEQTALLRSIMNVPGKAVEYSLDRYLVWSRQQIAAKAGR